MSEMGTLGIIGCYGLSDQLMHLIDQDEGIDHLFIVDNPEGLRFLEKMEARPTKINYSLVSENGSFLGKGGEFSVVLWLNSEDLHNDASTIQKRQSDALSRMSKYVDSIFFCYGLCRSTEQGIIDLTKQAAVPITFLTDHCGEIVDDCFAAVMGGKEEYLDHIKKHKGTLFATTGYVEAWRRKFRGMNIESMVREVEGMKYLFDSLEYHKVLVLDDGLGNWERFDGDVHNFSRLFDLQLDRESCDLSVFELTYRLAKEKMRTEELEMYSSELSEMEPISSESEIEMTGWLMEEKMNQIPSFK
jgi:hypothetical protein